MLVFFWILASLGVAYAAKLAGRYPGRWFIFSIVATPLGGSVALAMANRYGMFRKA